MQGPNFNLAGKIALITGAGRGIGLGMAEALAGVGCAVAIQDIELPVAQEAADKITASGGKAIALDGDVTDLHIAPRLVNQTVERLGGIHILINNAAIQKFIPFLELPLQEVEREYRANVVTPLALCQQVIPIFRQQKWGRIVNMGSIQQLRGSGFTAAYSMTKAAIKNLTTGLARELAADGITVNLIAPGYFDTWRNRGDEGTKEQNAKRMVPLGRIGRPEDCGGMIVLLCSEAGSYITGQSLHVDGGMA